MTRVSKISTQAEFEIEHRREALRERRWQRHRNMLFCAVCLLAVLGVTSPAPSVFIRWL